MRKKVTCPYCGHKNQSTEERCAECGASLPEEQLYEMQRKEERKQVNRALLFRMCARAIGSMVIIVLFALAPLLWNRIRPIKEAERRKEQLTNEIAAMAQEAQESGDEEGSKKSSPGVPPFQKAENNALSRKETESGNAGNSPTGPTLSQKAEDEALPQEGLASKAAEESGKYGLMPPYLSYDAADYALPEEVESPAEGRGENSAFQMSVAKVRRAPYLKYATLNLQAYAEGGERDEAWRKALHMDLVICELTLTNTSGAELQLYCPNFKASVDTGVMKISRPGMENTGERGLPLEILTMAAGEERTFVLTVPVGSDEVVTSIDYMESLNREDDMGNITIYIPLAPLS